LFEDQKEPRVLIRWWPTSVQWSRQSS